jgi:sulfur carrier protein
MSINITVNCEPCNVPAETTLLLLVERLGLNPRTIAAQVNDAIIERSAYGETVLHAHDVVELVRFVGGG